LDACDSLRSMGLRAWRVAAILLLGALFGLAWNAWSGRGFALRANAFLQEGEEEIEAKEAKARLDKGALFLDARPYGFYAMSHIPGARSLPEDDFDKAFAGLESALRTRFDIVVYCAGFGCEASHVVGRRLREKGIAAVVLHEGWPAWQAAGYPTKEGEEP
jgi:rhodanese-related sulfurtransferase